MLSAPQIWNTASTCLPVAGRFRYLVAVRDGYLPPFGPKKAGIRPILRPNAYLQPAANLLDQPCRDCPGLGE